MFLRKKSLKKVAPLEQKRKRKMSRWWYPSTCFADRSEAEKPKVPEYKFKSRWWFKESYYADEEEKEKLKDIDYKLFKRNNF